MTIKHPTPFCSCLSKSHKYDNYDKAPYIVSNSPTKQTSRQSSHATRRSSTPLLLPRIPTKHLYKCNFSKSLTYNWENLKEFCNRGISQDITNKTGIAWNPQPLRQCAEGIFQMQRPICAVNFTNKISRSSWTWHNLWNLLTINFRNKYFYNSVDWSQLYLQVYIPSWLANVLRFTIFRLLGNAFVKLPCPYHDH